MAAALSVVPLNRSQSNNRIGDNNAPIVTSEKLYGIFFRKLYYLCDNYESTQNAGRTFIYREDIYLEGIYEERTTTMRVEREVGNVK